MCHMPQVVSTGYETYEGSDGTFPVLAAGTFKHRIACEVYIMSYVYKNRN